MRRIVLILAVLVCADTGQERFIDDAEANAYLTKPYRKDFELPTL